MTSSHLGTLLHLNPECEPPLCSAIDSGVHGLAVCSLPADHGGQRHEMRCDEDPRVVLAAWRTDADISVVRDSPPHTAA